MTREKTKHPDKHMHLWLCTLLVHPPNRTMMNKDHSVLREFVGANFDIGTSDKLKYKHRLFSLECFVQFCAQAFGLWKQGLPFDTVVDFQQESGHRCCHFKMPSKLRCHLLGLQHVSRIAKLDDHSLLLVCACP